MHSLLDTLDLTQAPARQYILPQRACPRPVTEPLYHARLDQQLQRVLAHQLALPLARIAALHQTYPLGAIARRQHQDPATVLAALKTVTAAWAEVKVILHLVGPLQVDKDDYLTLRALDRWFDAPARTRLFPTPLPA